MNTKEILTKAKQIISEPNKWTQGFYARNADGYGVSTIDEGAVCWCSIGAIRVVAGFDDDADYVLDYFQSIVIAESTQQSIADFNDHPGRTHAEVMEMWDKAINSIPAPTLKRTSTNPNPPTETMKTYEVKFNNLVFLGDVEIAQCSTPTGAQELAAALNQGEADKARLGAMRKLEDVADVALAAYRAQRDACIERNQTEAAEAWQHLADETKAALDAALTLSRQ